MFTCVPVDLAVEIAQRTLSLDEDLSNRTSLSVQEVVKLLAFCLNATYLVFRGEFYQQTFAGLSCQSAMVGTVWANSCPGCMDRL